MSIKLKDKTIADNKMVRITTTDGEMDDKCMVVVRRIKLLKTDMTDECIIDNMSEQVNLKLCATRLYTPLCASVCLSIGLSHFYSF